MTVSQLSGLILLLAFTFVMCYVGPDYINPRECMFGGQCQYHPLNGNGVTAQPGTKRSLQSEEIVETLSRLAKRKVARYGKQEVDIASHDTANVTTRQPVQAGLH